MQRKRARERAHSNLAATAGAVAQRLFGELPPLRPLLWNHFIMTFAAASVTVSRAVAAQVMAGALVDTGYSSMLTAMHHGFACLCVAERRVVAVARATEATRRIAQDRKVVKLLGS